MIAKKQVSVLILIILIPMLMGARMERNWVKMKLKVVKGTLLNPWDFFDVPLPPGDPGTGTKNGSISDGDVAGVKAKFGTTQGGPPNKSGQNYNPAFDRTFVGLDRWDLGPPNGSITGADVSLVRAQFGHSCVSP